MAQVGSGRLARLPLPVVRALGRTPLLSADQRIQLARRVATRDLEHGEFARAERAVRGLLGRVDRPRRVADFIDDVVSEILARGHEPHLLPAAYSARLGAADGALAKGRHKVAASSFARAVELAFDRNVHFDTTTSPLARDARGFTKPLLESTYARAIRAPRGRARSGAGTPAQPGPRRVLVATRGNANFLGELTQMLAEHPEVESEHVDFAGNRKLARGIFDTAVVAEEILTGKHGMARRAEEVLRPHLDGTDTLFVEWCSQLAVLVNLVDPRDTRVIVRLHSYEAFTHWPHLLDYSRIDDMVFVSEHLRDFAVDVVPGLREANAPRLHVLPLAKDLQAYVRPKQDDARFTLALVGWGSVAKDPLWAFEVVRALRARDERYRLLLVGSEFAGATSPAAARYAERVARELADLEAAGAVVNLGASDDVPSVLSQVGVILSSSVRESFHAAVVEGAASGAVPVVRDWPFFTDRPTGARTLYPSEWIAETPAQAADRILATTESETVWRDTGAAASEHALATWDWTVVRPAYERLFLG